MGSLMIMQGMLVLAVLSFLTQAVLTSAAVAQPMLDPQPPGARSPQEWAIGTYWHTVHYRGGLVYEVVISPNPNTARVKPDDKLAIPFTPRTVNWSGPHRAGSYQPGLTSGVWKEWDINVQGRRFTVRFQEERYARPNLGRQPGDLSNMRWWVRCIDGRNPQVNNRPC